MGLILYSVLLLGAFALLATFIERATGLKYQLYYVLYGFVTCLIWAILGGYLLETGALVN